MIIDESKKRTKLPRLLRKALELFVKQGINATTTKDIAKRAKVAEGTIYRHFKSKDEMAWHIFYVNLMALTDSMFKEIEAADSAREQLRRAIAFFYNYCEEDPTLFQFLLLSRHQELHKFPATAKTPRHVLLEILARGKREGDIGPIDNELAAALALGMVMQVAESKIYGRISGDLRSQTDNVTDACWKAWRK